MASIVGEKGTRNATGDILSNLIGAEGLKANVAVKIAPSAIPVLVGSIVLAIAIGGVLTHFILRKISKK
jgi:hypothetical protein